MLAQLQRACRFHFLIEDTFRFISFIVTISSLWGSQRWPERCEVETGGIPGGKGQRGRVAELKS